MRRVFHYLRPQAGRIALGLNFKFTGTIMDLLLPWVLAHMIDVVIPQQDLSLVLRWGAAMLVFSIAGWCTSILANRMASRVAKETTRRLRHDLFARIARLSSAQIDRFTIPSLISRMTSDTYNIHQVIGMMQRIGFRAPILLLGGILITLTLDPVLTLVLLSLLPFMGLLVFLISRRGTGLFTQVQQSADRLVRVVRENIAGVRVIKALSKENYEKEHFEGVNRQMMGREQRAARNMAVINPSSNLIMNLGLVLVILTGAFRVNAGTSEVGTIVAFLSYFTIILNAMMSITRVITMYSKASASAQRIVEVLDTPPDLLQMEEAPAGDSGFRVVFEDVSFSYNKKEDNLSHISFALRPGETLGVIGPTGAGKSTLVSLLLRLYDPDQGHILVDGRDVRSYSLHALRQKFGVVFQNDALFEDTIGENIRLGRNLSMEQIEKGARAAQAAEFIENGRGYQGEVAIKGANLSGGQRQRLLIARALAAGPEILILDDSSSALDYKTDAALRQAIAKDYENTTWVIIAQRISSIRHADHILVLEEGGVLGYGTHQQLMETCPVYQEISRIQMGDDLDA